MPASPVAFDLVATLTLIACAAAAWIWGGRETGGGKGLGAGAGNRRWATVALVAAVVAAAAHMALYEPLRDDAFISFRYARNVAEGSGWVFNPGERVEGYSNFLLVAMLALLYGALGLPIVETSQVIGLVAWVGTAWVLHAWTGMRARGLGSAIEDESEPRARGQSDLAAILLVGGASAYAAFATSGMETALFCFWVVCALWRADGGKFVQAGVLAGLATMTRPDGVFVACAVAGVAVACREARVRHLVRATAGYALLIAPWTVWRVSYYGHLIPNQIAAKRGMDFWHQIELGAKYVIRGGIAHWPLVLLGVVAVIGLLRRRAAVRSRLRPGDVGLAVACALFLAFPLVAGGDWMPAYRFLVPACVVGAVLTARAWALAFAETRLGLEHRGARTAFALAAALMVGQGVLDDRVLQQTLRQNEVVRGEVAIGRWLARRLPADTTAAAWANGAIPFYSRLPTIDLVGLTDEHIGRRGLRRSRGHPGHVAYDHASVVERAPMVITYLSQSGLHTEPWDDRLSEYQPDYEAVCFEFEGRAAGAARFANLWIHRDHVARIAPLLVDREAGISRVSPDRVIDQTKWAERTR